MASRIYAIPVDKSARIGGGSTWMANLFWQCQWLETLLSALQARKYVKLNHWNSSLEIRYLYQQLQVTDIITCQLNPLFSCLPFETIFGDKSPNVDFSDIMTPLLLMQ